MHSFQTCACGFAGDADNSKQPLGDGQAEKVSETASDFNVPIWCTDLSRAWAEFEVAEAKANKVLSILASFMNITFALFIGISIIASFVRGPVVLSHNTWQVQWSRQWMMNVFKVSIRSTTQAIAPALALANLIVVPSLQKNQQYLKVVRVAAQALRFHQRSWLDKKLRDYKLEALIMDVNS